MPLPQPGDLTVATQNLQRLFDDRRNGPAPVIATADYQRRLDKLARQVVEGLREPDLLAVQEVENPEALAALAAAVSARSGRPAYRVLHHRGPDRGSHHAGYLVRADWEVLSLEPLLASVRLGRAPLFDRPPLRLRVRTTGGVVLDVVNVHLKSLRGSDDPDEARRIARKRSQQADALAGWLEDRLAHEPSQPLLLIGDFNAVAAATPEGLGVDVLGRLQATGLVSALSALPASEHYSYVHDCRAQALDHALLSSGWRLRMAAYSRGNAGAPARYAREASHALRSSDHDGLVLYLRP